MQLGPERFKANAQAALADRTLKIAIDRTTGTAVRKRAEAVAEFPEFDAASAARAADQGPCDRQPRPLSGDVRAQRDRRRQPGPLGGDRGRGLPHRHRDLPDGGCAPCDAREVDAGRGDRPAAWHSPRPASSGSRPIWPSISSSSPARRLRTSSGRRCTAPRSRSRRCSRPRTASRTRARTRRPWSQSARRELREKFLTAEVGISGANFLDRRHGCRLRRHQRGQRRAHHHPAARAHRDGRDREAGALDRTRHGHAAPPRPLGHRRRADPVHDLPLRPEAAGRCRRPRGDAHRPRRQRPLHHAGDRAEGDAALHSLRRLHEPLRRLPPDRRPRLWRRLSGADGRCAHPGPRPASPSRATCRTPAP